MKTSKHTITSPELFVDDHHGIYMGQIAFNQLSDYYKKQAIAKLSKEDIEAIQDVDNEWYCEACDNFTRIEFHTPTGQKLYINYAEGGMWILPACFLRTKKASEFFGS